MKLMIGVMSDNETISRNCFTSLIDMITEVQSSGVSIEIVTASTAPIDQKNILLNKLLLSDADAILVIDGRLSFSPEIVLNMLASGRDFVAGLAANTFFSWENMLDKQDVDSLRQSAVSVSITAPEDEDEDGFMQVASTDCKFFYVTKKALDSVKDKFPTRLVSPDNLAIFFSNAAVQSGDELIWLSSDEFFCKQMSEAGYPPAVDARSKVINILGNMLY